MFLGKNKSVTSAPAGLGAVDQQAAAEPHHGGQKSFLKDINGRFLNFKRTIITYHLEEYYGNETLFANILLCVRPSTYA